MKTTHFNVGQLVTIDRDRLGEVVEQLPDSEYRLWVEDDQRGYYATVSSDRMEVLQ